MDRTLQPAFKKSLAFSLPEPEKIHAVGDHEIWYLPSAVSEAVKIEIVFKAGKYFDRQIGNTKFTLHLLDKGLKGKNANAIANELDYYGAHLDLKVGYDFSSLSLYGLRKNVDRLLPLLFSIIYDPIFPQEELNLLKKQTIENLKISLQKNEFIASNRIRGKLYETHPYGQIMDIEDVESIDLEQVKKFFQTQFTPFKFFIVGNASEDSLKTIISTVDFQSSREDLMIPVNAGVPHQQIIEGPNKIQASIRLGKISILRTHPDWAGLQLLNHILGGYFGSRLMKNIREEKGLTYGIHSSIQSMFYSTWLNISAEVNSDSIEIALLEINKELKKLNKINTEELEMAKNHFIGSLQNDITTIFSACESIKNIILNKLPSDYYHTLISKIDSLKQDELERISETHFKPELFSSVVVK